MCIGARACGVPLALTAAASALCLPLLTPAHAGCQFLQPIGGDGVTPIVNKTVGPGKVFGRTNWNTDVVVTGYYAPYTFFFNANSSDPIAT